MLLKRVELNLTGPDSYPADEGSYAIWEAREKYAKRLLVSELSFLKQRITDQLRDPQFEVEILGIDLDAS